MNRKELSAVVAECAARTERAAVWQRETVARAEAARAKHEERIAKHEEGIANHKEAMAGHEEAMTKHAEEIAKEISRARAQQETAIARQEAATAKLDQAVARGEETRARQEKLHRDHVNRIEAMMAENKEWTKKIFAELDDQRDERRALIEALSQAIDRLPPPPPHLRSA